MNAELWRMDLQNISWRVDIQKGVTHISEILHGGTETFPFRHLEIQIFDLQIENKNISDWKKNNRLRYCIGINLKNLFGQKNDFWKIVGYALLNVHSSVVSLFTPRGYLKFNRLNYEKFNTF